MQEHLISWVISKGGLNDLWVVQGFKVGVEVHHGFEGNKEKD